jgi:predicted transcriptional regulator
MSNGNTADEYLQAIAAQLKKGVAPPNATVRSFLGKFGFARRGFNAVGSIREEMKKHGVATVPDLEQTYIDAEIAFVRAPTEKKDLTSDSAGGEAAYRLAVLKSANSPLVSVVPTAPLQQAVTLMLANDYSQLPVMCTPREVKGVISWKGIGSQLALKRTCKTVGECMHPAQIMDSGESLFAAITVINQYDYVLVKQRDKIISGIVTASDLNDQFRTLAEPFLIVGEIENGIRSMLYGRFTAKELDDVKLTATDAREIGGIDQLSFGDYVRLIQTENGWEKLNLEIDRTEFLSRLNEVRSIRNDIMHFSPDRISDDDIVRLRRFAQFLAMLRGLNGD